VLEALDRFGIHQNGNGHKRVGPLPFGFDYLNHQLVKNKGEQPVIRTGPAGCLCARSPAISTRSSSRPRRTASGKPESRGILARA
jgi:hypothetical protein